MKKMYQTIPVHEISHEELAETGHEVGDEDADKELYSNLIKRNFINRLTPRQRQVVIVLGEEEKTRRSAALTLLISLQAIHQIVARIKERFPEADPRRVRNLTWFFWMIYPGTDAKTIRRYWYSHPVLKDYPRPDEETLESWYRRYADYSLFRPNSAASGTEESPASIERRGRDT